MTDFERMYKIIINTICDTEIDAPQPETEEMIGLKGCISIWDKKGCNSIDIYFNPNGNFEGIFIND